MSRPNPRYEVLAQSALDDFRPRPTSSSIRAILPRTHGCSSRSQSANFSFSESPGRSTAYDQPAKPSVPLAPSLCYSASCSENHVPRSHDGAPLPYVVDCPCLTFPGSTRGAVFPKIGAPRDHHPRISPWRRPIIGTMTVDDLVQRILLVLVGCTGGGLPTRSLPDIPGIPPLLRSLLSEPGQPRTKC